VSAPPAKTPFSALVVVPAGELWEPIQRIRREYDRKVDRWMPHATLLHPFLPHERFDEAQPMIAEACASIEPFEATLATFRSFDHGRDRFTMWLALDPPEPFRALHAALQPRFPGCDDVARFAGGFTPHLSVGQADGRPELEERMERIRSDWVPLRLVVKEVALISRAGEEPFKVDRVVPIGGPR
jgi:2'-5' RNA ligase